MNCYAKVNGVLRYETALALRMLGFRSVVPGLVSELDAAETPAEKARLVSILGRLEDVSAVRPLVEVIQEK